MIGCIVTHLLILHIFEYYEQVTLRVARADDKIRSSLSNNLKSGSEDKNRYKIRHM